MNFRVFLHKRASKFLEELMPENKQRIVEKLRRLKGFPETELDIVKVAGEENTFRLRVGKRALELSQALCVARWMRLACK